ncbi:MAG TPA: DUF1638 domain-containing protein [Candidatus Competibacteraceae bacterium]|nr:DUF1638 domain-containing protein [Candidatus Competibacteraceae bacterium]
MARDPDLLVIACGAIAHELMAVIRANRWQDVKVQCLPAELHNRPERIPEAVRAKIRAARECFQRIFVAYADCGTGGLLDAVLAEEGVERLPGAHCYEFFAGSRRFAALAEAEPGSFYLTDFLVRHFERLVIHGLGLERHPELMPMYFGHYRRLVYLAQRHDPYLQEQAHRAAERLGLEYEYHYTGYGELEPALKAVHQP